MSYRLPSQKTILLALTNARLSHTHRKDDDPHALRRLRRSLGLQTQKKMY